MALSKGEENLLRLLDWMTVLAEGAASTARLLNAIGAVIGAAQREGRPVTDEEFEVIRKEMDGEEKITEDILAKLRAGGM